MGIQYLSESTDHYPPRKSSAIVPALLTALGALSQDSPLPPWLAPKAERPARRCALPGCNNFHTHNGGYCCPEHCQEHRKRKG